MQTYKKGVGGAFHYFLLLGSYVRSVIDDGFKAGIYSSYLASLLFI